MTSPASSARADERERREREWLAQIRAGDALAFERMFRAYVAPLCSFALSYVRTRDAAEEIVQDLFCRLWEQRHTLEMPHGMRLYLYASVRNRSLNALRNQRAEVSMRERLASEARPERVDDTASSGLDVAAAQELYDAVARVVATMPPRCREVFTLLRYQHLRYAEVARVLSISPKTVEIHMTRALAILRARLAAWLSP